MKYKVGSVFSFSNDKLTIKKGYIKDIYKGRVEIYFNPWDITTIAAYIYPGTGKAKIPVETFIANATFIAEAITTAERDEIQKARMTYATAKEDLEFLSMMLESSKNYDKVPQSFIDTVLTPKAPYKSTQADIDHYSEEMYKVFADN